MVNTFWHEISICCVTCMMNTLSSTIGLDRKTLIYEHKFMRYNNGYRDQCLRCSQFTVFITFCNNMQSVSILITNFKCKNVHASVHSWQHISLDDRADLTSNGTGSVVSPGLKPSHQPPPNRSQSQGYVYACSLPRCLLFLCYVHVHVPYIPQTGLSQIKLMLLSNIRWV